MEVRISSGKGRVAQNGRSQRLILERLYRHTALLTFPNVEPPSNFFCNKPGLRAMRVCIEKFRRMQLDNKLSLQEPMEPSNRLIVTAAEIAESQREGLTIGAFDT